MDLKEQVARRRVELAEEQREVDRVYAGMKARAAQQEREQREQPVDLITANLAASGMPVKREGEEIVLSPPPTPIDVTELRRSKLNQLLNREARRMWTPTENWLAISAIAAGVPLLLFFGVDVLLIAVGADLRNKYNKKYRAEVLTIYPQLKEALQAS